MKLPANPLSLSQFKNKVICVSCFLLLFAKGNAFETTPAAYLGIEQGLSNNGVTSIFRDHNGFMWFGTYDGLNRYDGYTFRIFRNNLNDSTSISTNYVGVINEDSDFHLWIGTNRGISIYRPDKASFLFAKFKSWNTHIFQPLENAVRAIENIGNGMLVGMYGKGVILFEKNSRLGVQIPAAFLKGHEGEYDVMATAFDVRRNAVWIMIPQAGLCLYDVKRNELRKINATIKKADCLKMDSKGNLWLGNENGLFRYNVDNNTFSSSVLPRAYRTVSLFEDKHSVLWIGTDGGGIWSTFGDSLKVVPYLSNTGTSPINSNTVYAIYDDPQGNKWIGTLRGGVNLIKTKSGLFKHIKFTHSADDDIVNDFILSFAEDDKGNVWIGTDGAGLRYWDRHKNTFKHYKHSSENPGSISSDFVTSIVYDSQGDVWATSYLGGVNRLKKGTKNFEHFNCYNSTTDAIENNAWLIYEDSKKRLWVGTSSGGSLYLFNRATNRFDVFDTRLSNIQSLFEDSEGVLWAGRSGSLIKVDDVNKKHRTYNIGHTALSIHEDREKKLWLGTDGGGLVRFDRKTGHIDRFTISDGLPSNTVLRILEDRHQNLWLSTYNGLSKFNPRTRLSRNYSQSDGLQSNQFSFHAGLALKSGAFLFGGIKGFNLILPDSIDEREIQREIYLTDLRINNTSIERESSYVTERTAGWVKKIKLSFDETVISLDYVAIDYQSADKLKYAYKLDGWDKDWTFVNNIRTANYSRLHEGTYTFKVKILDGSNEDEGSDLLTIVVLPPWYRTWWAYLLYFVCVVGSVYVYILYNRRQERLKYDIKLANFEKEKEKELTERKLSFFTNISHEFRTPLTLIINPVKDLLRKIDTPDEHKELNIVHRNARRLLSLVDQLLIFRKADAGADNMKFSRQNFYSLCEEVYLCFVQQAKMNRQDYVFECDNKELELFVDRQKIEIALFNLISNAIKYTPGGGRIVFKIAESKEDVEVSMSDNGPGISKEAAVRLFEKFYQVSSEGSPIKTGFGIGLYLVKHFVEGHKGTVSFESEESSGTTFLVKLKKGQYHLEGQVIADQPHKETPILEELKEEAEEEWTVVKEEKLEEVFTEQKTILVVDDNKSIREYLYQILKDKYLVLEAENGEKALQIAQTKFPDLVISDIKMDVLDGIELCKQIRIDPSLNHIPVILLTGTPQPGTELQSIEGGADVYITKPFDKEILFAKMENLFKSRTELQNYFFNEITLKKNTLKISPEYKEFLERCIEIVERHLDDDQFSVKTLCQEIGISHNLLYKKVKTISGQTIASFIRFIRLRKAAELLIKTDCNVNQVSYQVGISDTKYFRVQFNKLFGMNPSAYIKKYRDPFNRTYKLSSRAKKKDPDA